MSPTRGQYYTHSRTLHDGTETIVHYFSKELLAYFETLVAFCQYYHADDPQVTTHIDEYFHSALEKYRGIPNDELHGFLTERLTGWYDKYPPAAATQLQVPSCVCVGSVRVAPAAAAAAAAARGAAAGGTAGAVEPGLGSDSARPPARPAEKLPGGTGITDLPVPVSLSEPKLLLVLATSSL
jgi:hypothetical protein